MTLPICSPKLFPCAEVLSHVHITSGFPTALVKNNNSNKTGCVENVSLLSSRLTSQKFVAVLRSQSCTPSSSSFMPLTLTCHPSKRAPYNSVLGKPYKVEKRWRSKKGAPEKKVNLVNNSFSFFFFFFCLAYRGLPLPAVIGIAIIQRNTLLFFNFLVATLPSCWKLLSPSLDLICLYNSGHVSKPSLAFDQGEMSNNLQLISGYRKPHEVRCQS